ncbi:hypothetical protein I5E68_09740 [Novosphingobium sp. YJ-S2-02]|uniref:Uncharacterized protein n=1 Tax=Novosphingobium aureum TaxID=2792964 RepID=A0A931MKS2_9SPHN|nr:hypothetical protein [Novosphingobium aureum]MBH0113227.1 hypothetical protein [Novosphingobium aureum]
MILVSEATGPAAWVGYFINGDADGLEPEELAAADAWLQRHAPARPVSTVDDSERFSWSYNVHGGTAQGGTVCDYVLHAAADELPVIFRAERSGDHVGEVTAVFPTLPNDRHGREFTTYAHIGQHSGGSFGWYRATRPATHEEFAPLLRELRGIYERSMAPGDPVYSLKVCQRITAAHRRACVDAARASGSAAA